MRRMSWEGASTPGHDAITGEPRQYSGPSVAAQVATRRFIEGVLDDLSVQTAETEGAAHAAAMRAIVEARADGAAQAQGGREAGSATQTYIAAAQEMADLLVALPADPLPAPPARAS